MRRRVRAPSPRSDRRSSSARDAGANHTRFNRGAVVSDDSAIRTGLNVLKRVLHGDVRTFQNPEDDKAVRWVSG